MNVKKDLYDMFRQPSVDYANKNTPDFGDSAENAETFNEVWTRIMDAYQEGAKGVIDFITKNYNVTPKESDEKYCQCEEPDRDTGYVYCQRCHKNVSDARMRFLVNKDEMFKMPVFELEPAERRRQQIEYNNMCARATLYPGKTIGEVKEIQILDRIEETYKFINELIINSQPMNTPETRRYVADLLQRKINNQVIVKCNEENNTPEIIDMQLLVAELFWNVPYDAKTPQIQHSILVFGTDDQIDKYQRQYMLDNEMFKFIQKGI